MGHIIVQVYEIQDPHEAEKLIQLGVDHIGSVVLSKEEWCNHNIREVVRITKQGGAKSSIIPLFSDFDAICRVVDYYQPNILHFCEMLPPHQSEKAFRESLCELQRKIKEYYPNLLIMRSIPIPEKGKNINFPVLKIAKEFQPVSDIFLTDTVMGSTLGAEMQPVKGFVGITGKECNWEMAAELVQKSSLPVILAGGLSPSNVREAILKVKPWGVDTCTGTNLVDENGNPVRFKKDFNKIQEFLKEVRLAESQL